MASGNIKGITIQFNGDTTRLDKALREINNQTKSLDRELKAVNNALKFNPTNVELWRQKQTLLNQKVDETKKKLDVLKQAQAQLDAKGVDRNSEEYRQLQRQIIVTENQVKNFEKELRQVGNANLKALSEQFKQVGSKAQAAGKALSTHVTAPIVAVGAASVKAFTEVKDGLNIVASKTGATGEELTKMQDIARNIAKTIPTDFESAGTAVGELNTRFGLTGKELESLSEQYIKFAKVNGSDLNDSIDETQKALAAFGLTAKEAPKLLDTLTKAGQLTGASVDDLTSGLIQNATAFQELGLNIDQSVLLMAQLEKSGANSETVMQGLRKALKNAAKEGKPLDVALTELQDTIKNGSGSVDGLTAAYDLFGKSGDQIYGAVKNGTIDFRLLGEAAVETGGTLDSVFEETLTPAEKFQTTMNSMKDAGYELGYTIMTMLEPYMNKLAKNAQKLSKWWSKLDKGTKEIIVKVALFAATLGPLLILFGKLATGISAIINAINLMGGAISLVSAGPLVAIVAAIAAVIAIGVLLYKNWDTIKAKCKQLGDGIKSIWTSVKTAISNAASAIFDAMTWPYRKAWDTIKSVVSSIRNLFPINIGNLFSKIKLPHFSWTWKKLGKFVNIPKISVDWYANGGIFDSPTVAGIGEAGSEAVVPLDKFWDKMDAIAAASSGNGPVINVYATPGMDVNELAVKVEQILVRQQKQRSMAYGGI